MVNSLQKSVTFHNAHSYNFNTSKLLCNIFYNILSCVFVLATFIFTTDYVN